MAKFNFYQYVQIFISGCYLGYGVCTTKCEFDAIKLHREHPECSTMVNSDDKMKAILPYMIKRKIAIKKAKKG